MKTAAFDTLFSVVCLPESPSLFMLNMQVFQIHPDKREQGTGRGEPQAIVWCAVYQRPVIRKP